MVKKLSVEMDAEALAFDDLYKHLAHYTIRGTKRGYLNGEEHQVMYLVDSWNPETNEGRWIIKFRGEVSYVSPALYQLLSDNTHSYVLGQTLGDGTLMTNDKVLELARRRTLGTGSQAQQFQQQLNLLPISTINQPCTAAAETKSKKRTATKTRKPKDEMGDVFVVATRGEEHVDPAKSDRQPPKKRRRTNVATKLVNELDKKSQHLMKSLHATSQDVGSFVSFKTEEQRAQIEAIEQQIDKNYKSVEVCFL